MLKNICSALIGGVMVFAVMWAYWSDRVALCQSEVVTLKAEHQAMAEALVKAQADKDQAYQWIAETAAAKVDLTIPFKPIKAEQVAVQSEVGQIDAMAKFLSKAENAWKLATRGR